MNGVPDREKLRREYVSSKMKAYIHVVFAWLLFLPVVTASVYFGLIAITSPMLMRDKDASTIVFGFGTVSAVILGFIARGIWELVKVGTVNARVSYVPPVTPSTLPSEEVLLRGAAEPAALSETLLRAAVKGEETEKAEELLRSSQR